MPPDLATYITSNTTPQNTDALNRYLTDQLALVLHDARNSARTAYHHDATEVEKKQYHEIIEEEEEEECEGWKRNKNRNKQVAEKMKDRYGNTATTQSSGQQRKVRKTKSIGKDKDKDKKDYKKQGAENTVYQITDEQLRKEEKQKPAKEHSRYFSKDSRPDKKLVLDVTNADDRSYIDAVLEIESSSQNSLASRARRKSRVSLIDYQVKLVDRHLRQKENETESDDSHEPKLDTYEKLDMNKQRHNRKGTTGRQLKLKQTKKDREEAKLAQLECREQAKKSKLMPTNLNVMKNFKSDKVAANRLTIIAGTKPDAYTQGMFCRGKLSASIPAYKAFDESAFFQGDTKPKNSTQPIRPKAQVTQQVIVQEPSEESAQSESKKSEASLHEHPNIQEADIEFASSPNINVMQPIASFTPKSDSSELADAIERLHKRLQPKKAKRFDDLRSLRYPNPLTSYSNSASNYREASPPAIRQPPADFFPASDEDLYLTCPDIADHHRIYDQIIADEDRYGYQYEDVTLQDSRAHHWPHTGPSAMQSAWQEQFNHSAYRQPLHQWDIY